MYLIAMKNWTASDSSQREEKNIKLNMLNTMKKKKYVSKKTGTSAESCSMALLAESA